MSSDNRDRGDWSESVVAIRRCAAVVKGGRRFSFNALVVVGNGRGQVAWGYGKANEVPPSVEKGVKGAMERGILAGYPVVDTKVRLVDGSYHEVDSSGPAFEVAGSLGFQEAAKTAGMQLLEPIMTVEIVTPEEYLGDVIGDVNARRGRITDMGQRANLRVLKSLIPLAELFGYATDLRSKTQGRADHTMQFSTYEAVPQSLQEEIIAKQRGF